METKYIQDFYKPSDQVIMIPLKDHEIVVDISAFEKDHLDGDKIVDLDEVMKHFPHLRFEPGAKLLATPRRYASGACYRHVTFEDASSNQQVLHSSITSNISRATRLPHKFSLPNLFTQLVLEDSDYTYWELIRFLYSLEDYESWNELHAWKWGKILPIPDEVPLTELFSAVVPYIPSNHPLYQYTTSFLDEFTWKKEKHPLLPPHIIKRKGRVYLIFYTLDIGARARITKHFFRFEPNSYRFREKKFILAKHRIGVWDLKENPDPICYPTYYPPTWQEDEPKPWHTLDAKGREAEEEYHLMTPDAWISPHPDDQIVVLPMEEDHYPVKELQKKLIYNEKPKIYFLTDLPNQFPHLQFDSNYLYIGISDGYRNSLGCGFAIKKESSIEDIAKKFSDLSIFQLTKQELYQLPDIYDPMELITGDGSPNAYWEAILLKNSLREFGCTWHNVHWWHYHLLPIHHSVLEVSPYERPRTLGKHATLREIRQVFLTKMDWCSPKPTIWHPHIIQNKKGTKLIYHVFSLYFLEEIVKIICIFPQDSLNFEQRKITLATGKEGYIL